MAKTAFARHPMEWTFEAMRSAVARSDPALVNTAPLVVNRISLGDLALSLRQGWADFVACRTDAVLLCIMYPLAGLLIARLVMGEGVLPLVFPLVAGFALLGPLLATGTYQMSRTRERTGEANWADAFSAFGSPAIGSIMLLGLWLLAIFSLWLLAAGLIYSVTLAPRAPIYGLTLEDQPLASYGAFLHGVLSTGGGWALVVLGIGVGAVFATFVLAISVVSFPLLLDRNTGMGLAVGTSIRAVRLNPVPIAVWGATVAGLLVLGSLPLLIGLAIVMPILGHATWHLYRKLIVPAA